MTKVKLMNPFDWLRMKVQGLSPELVRALELEMLVDTGAAMAAVPEEVVESLDLPYMNYKQRVSLADGSVRELSVVSVAFEILGRDDTCSFLVLP
ncbi:MAG TPA: retropepsin-like aspartic protease, partial [Polyangiaceae bacterium]